MLGPVPLPTLVGWMDELSNWGRWGDEDELGTLNLVDRTATLRGHACVSDGTTVGLGRRIAPGHTAEHEMTAPPLHHMLRAGEAAGAGMVTASDWLGLEFHGFAVTHVDAPSHVFWDGRMYQGRPAELVSTRHGATAGSIERMGDGVVSRGLLVDVPASRGVEWLEPAEAVGPDELHAILRAASLEPAPGDVLLVRTGLGRRRAELGPHGALTAGNPGLHPSCLPWLHEHGIAILGSDGVNDAMPSAHPGMRMPIHVVGLVAMGLWLIDNADLEGIAELCAASGRWEFLLALAPLRIKHGTGSPVNPIAVM